MWDEMIDWWRGEIKRKREWSVDMEIRKTFTTTGCGSHLITDNDF